MLSLLFIIFLNFGDVALCICTQFSTSFHSLHNIYPKHTTTMYITTRYGVLLVLVTILILFTSPILASPLSHKTKPNTSPVLSLNKNRQRSVLYMTPSTQEDVTDDDWEDNEEEEEEEEINLSDLDIKLYGQPLDAQDDLHTTRIVSCGSSESDIINIHTIELLPDPPVRGGSLTIQATGIVKESINEGDIFVEVRLLPIKLLDKKFDLCSEVGEVDLQCPIKQGDLTLKKVVDLPEAMPPVSLFFFIYYLFGANVLILLYIIYTGSLFHQGGFENKGRFKENNLYHCTIHRASMREGGVPKNHEPNI